MTGGTVLSGILGIAIAVGSAQATTQQPSSAPDGGQRSPTPRFRSSVDVVSVAAVVRDRKGRFVKDLAKKDFEIVEDGRLRPILDFRAESNGPIKLGLLLDISG